MHDIWSASIYMHRHQDTFSEFRRKTTPGWTARLVLDERDTYEKVTNEAVYDIPYPASVRIGRTEGVQRRDLWAWIGWCICLEMRVSVASISVSAWGTGVSGRDSGFALSFRRCQAKLSVTLCQQRAIFQSYGFSSTHVQMWALGHKEGWMPKNWCFRIVVLEKTLESPLDCKIKPVYPKGNQPWIFIGRTDAEAEAPILWPSDANG